MAKMTKRSHSKVAKLPEEIRAAVDRKIMEGVEYQEIADYINSMGTSVSRSSVNRYGQKFMAKMERLRLARSRPLRARGLKQESAFLLRHSPSRAPCGRVD